MKWFLPRVTSGWPKAPSRWGRIAWASLLPLGLLGCVAQMMPAGVTMLTAQPNPSTDGAYTVLWPHVPGAAKYRLFEDGELAFEGFSLSHAVANKPNGSYRYALTYCVEAFGFEACHLRPLRAEVTVVVVAREPVAEPPEPKAPRTNAAGAPM